MRVSWAVNKCTVPSPAHGATIEWLAGLHLTHFMAGGRLHSKRW